jgi:hypothetical protein
MATAKKKKKKRKLASAKRRAEKHSQGFERTSTSAPDGMRYFQLKSAGMKRIDILPYQVTVTNRFADAGEWHYEKTFHVHRIGPSGEMYVCPKRTSDSKCPICDHVAKLQRDPNADEDLIKGMRAKERQLFYVIDNDEPEHGVQLWDISHYLFGRSLDARIKNSEDEDGYDTFFDPEDGMTIRLGVAERSFNGRSFYEVETVDFKERKKPIDPELFENLPSLDELIKVEDFNKLKAIFLQISGDEEGEDDEDEELEEEAAEMDEAFDKAVNEDAADETTEDEEDFEDDDDDDWDD